VASRREASTIIEEGRITVDNIVISEPGHRITGKENIALDGEAIHMTKKHVYIMLNKPVGYICTNKDPEGRPTAVSLVQSQFSQRLFTVGRLDVQSSGLILCTSDGAFADALMHPRQSIEKEYIVDTQQEIPEQLLKEWKKTIRIAREKYTLKRYQLMSPKRVRIILEEGKNKEIRNVFAHYKITVRKLHRIRIGDIHIGDLPKSGFQAIPISEVDLLISGKTKDPAVREAEKKKRDEKNDWQKKDSGKKEYKKGWAKASPKKNQPKKASARRNTEPGRKNR
jgi:23S rRNA pseudouridine2605 synthase